MKIVSVKFKNFGNSYFFINENIDLIPNDHVIVDTENGEQYAKVINEDVQDIKNINKESMKKIIRKSTKEDEDKYLKNIKDAHEALIYAKNKLKQYGLDIRLLDANYTFDKKQLTINFISDNRVDFRDFVKDLASKYKTRIELHQIGVRDKSKITGGLGLCGRPLCCSTFLNGMCTISINMAKNQNLALNPTKINGLCGRLLCCLSYEDDVYTEHRKILPKIGQRVKTPDGTVGKVTNLDVLNNKYTVEINGEYKEYEVKSDN